MVTSSFSLDGFEDGKHLFNNRKTNFIFWTTVNHIDQYKAMMINY